MEIETESDVSTIGKIVVYGHCFCYSNLRDMKQKNSFSQFPIGFWMDMRNRDDVKDILVKPRSDGSGN